MYSSPFATSLSFRPLPSRWLAAWIVLTHGLAATCLVAVGLGWPAAPLAVAVIPLSLARAFRPLGPDVHCITWSPARGWGRESDRGEYFPMELKGSSVVTNAALFLHWTDRQGAWRVLVPADSLDDECFRRLKVLVRFHDAGRTHC